jgi:hypothetical protein
MKIRKVDFVQFKNQEVYKAAQQDVQEAAQNALGELFLSEDLSITRQAFLRGFISGCRAILDWEPEFVDDEEEENDSES